MAGETVVTISATGQTSVTIWCTKLDHNLDKPIINIQIPRQTDGANSFSGTAVSYLIDIGRVKELISVQGFLIDDATTSATEKKANLMTITKDMSKATLSWGTGNRAQTAVGSINKVGFTETAGQIGESKTGYEIEKNFAVQLGFMVGTDKGGGD